MAASYLDPSEYAAYGVPTATAGQVAAASRLIDTYCNRSQGFVWTPDKSGRGGYMAGANADLSLTATAPIPVGTNVNVQVGTRPLITDYIGKVVIIDRASSTICETAVISGVNSPAPGWITLDAVVFNHPGTPLLEGGLVIFEERYCPTDRSMIRVGQWPVANVLSMQGRYAYGRRSQQVTGGYTDFNLLAFMQQFGGPPAWVGVDVAQVGLNNLTGEVWVPAGVLLAYYTDVRIWYIAGWTLAQLPDPIKQACANIVNTLIQVAGTPMGSSAFKKVQAGDTSIERFKNVAIDDQTAILLSPFRATVVY